jgi:hypothetical protein
MSIMKYRNMFKPYQSSAGHQLFEKYRSLNTKRLFTEVCLMIEISIMYIYTYIQTYIHTYIHMYVIKAEYNLCVDDIHLIIYSVVNLSYTHTVYSTYCIKLIFRCYKFWPPTVAIIREL